MMALDRVLLTTVFTMSIMVGGYLKDRRLLFYLGDTYRDYQARVPGYPLAFGPLGRVSLRPFEAPVAQAPRRPGELTPQP